MSLERVAVDDEQVRFFAFLDGADLLLCVKGLGRIQRCGFERYFGGDAGFDPES